MGREFELKYRSDPEKSRAIREKFGEFAPISMETTYYDTPDGSLGSRRWTLRRRLENGKSICTLKTPLPDGSRGEWETESNSITDALEELCKLGAPEELLTLAQKGLAEVCSARFTRLAATLEAGDSILELALDEGALLGGGKSLPLCEVEVELKSGSDAAAEAFANGLAEEFSLVPEPKSKVRRALELTGTL